MAIRAGSSVSEEKQREGKRKRRRMEKVKCMFGLRDNVRNFCGLVGNFGSFSTFAFWVVLAF